jgi:hypothetical protein
MTALRDSDFVVWDGEIIPGDDARGAASEARHGGRLITAALARHLGPEAIGGAGFRSDVSGMNGMDGVCRAWHYSIEPAAGRPNPAHFSDQPSWSGSRRSLASVAKGFAIAGGNRDLGYLRNRRGTVPLAAFDWPIYQSAFQARAIAQLTVAGAI